MTLKAFTTVLAGAFACGLACAPQVSGAQTRTQNAAPAAASAELRALQRKTKVWQICLSALTKRENAALLFDVDPDAIPPTLRIDKPFGVETMKAMGRSCRRVWKQVGGVQTFSRVDVPRGADQVAAAFSWIESLGDDQFKQLASSSMQLSDLDDQARDLIGDLAGWDPDVSLALVGQSSATQVRLVVRPMLIVTDPQTGAKNELEIPSRPGRTSQKAHLADTPQPLATPATGPLKFGQGVVLDLTTLMERAGKVFGVQYAVDGRILHNAYFISGSYDRESFEQAIGRVTTVPAVRVRAGRHRNFGSDAAELRRRIAGLAPDTIDVTELRRSIPMSGSADIDRINQQFGSQEELESSDFLQGKTETAGQLAEGKPGLTAFLQSRGVPLTSTVTLEAQFTLAILGDGMHQSSLASAQIDGTSVPVSSPDYALIGLE
jgi:hypothetical protein